MCCLRPKSLLCSCRHCQWFCAGPTRHHAVSIRQARKIRTDWPGRHNNLNKYAPGRPCTEHEPVAIEVGVLRRGWVTFGEYFTEKEASPTNHCWCQKTKVIVLSVVSKHPQCIISFCHRQTDRIARAIPCVALHAVAWQRDLWTTQSNEHLSFTINGRMHLRDEN